MRPTALVVIDVQRAAFDGQVCPPIANAQALLNRVAALIAGARAAGIAVLHVQHCGPAGDAFAEGSERAEIHPDVAPRGDEPVLRKHASSAFDDTAIESLLDAAGIGRIVVCGLQSDQCVCNTSLGALARGFSVLVAQDAHSTWPSGNDSAEFIVERYNQLLERQGARLLDTADAIALFAEARSSAAGAAT